MSSDVLADPPVLDLSEQGTNIIYRAISLSLQSIFYGMHLLLAPFGVYLLLNREREQRPWKYILFAMFCPFLLSSMYEAFQLAYFLVDIQIFLSPTKQYFPTILFLVPLGNALILINFLTSDAVVVWRAWVVCKDEFRTSLLVPTFFLALAALSFTSTIGLTIASYFTTAGPYGPDPTPVIDAIDYLEVSNVIWSLLTNFTATFIVSLKAWRHGQLLRAGLRDAASNRTRAEQILALLVESGVLYSVSAGFTLVFTFIRLPIGTVGDMLFPISTQLSGIYPAVVVVCISLQRTKDRTLQWHTSIRPSEPAAIPAPAVSEVVASEPSGIEVGVAVEDVVVGSA